MYHVHGPHECYCPNCGYLTVAAEGVKCNSLACPDCGLDLRALDIGEYRLAESQIIGDTQADLAFALVAMESSINKGDKATVTICTDSMPTKYELKQICADMRAMGCHVSMPKAMMVTGIPTTEFVIRKGSPIWSVIIPALVPLFTIGLITFGITKIESISKAIVPVILSAGGVLILLAVALRKPAEKYIERGGKYIPSTSKKLLAVG